MTKTQHAPAPKYYQPIYRDRDPTRKPAMAPFRTREEMEAYIGAQGWPVVQESWVRRPVQSALTLVPCAICKVPLPTSEAEVIFPVYNYTTNTLDCWDYYHAPCWLESEHMRPHKYRYVLPRNWATEKIFRRHEEAGEDMSNPWGRMKGPELDLDIPETTETGEFVAD